MTDVTSTLQCKNNNSVDIDLIFRQTSENKCYQHSLVHDLQWPISQNNMAVKSSGWWRRKEHIEESHEISDV